MEKPLRTPQPTAYGSAVEFRVLGPVQALHGGAALTLGGPKQRTPPAIAGWTGTCGWSASRQRWRPRHTHVNGGFVVTIRSGREVHIWDLESGDEVFAIDVNTGRPTVAFLSDDGTTLWYAAANHILTRTFTNGDDLEATARSRGNRPFTVEECERFLYDTDCSVYAEE